MFFLLALHFCVVSVSPLTSVVSLHLKQVDEGVIMYEHLHGESAGWSAEDFFTFTVSSPPSALDLQVFHIVISYEITRHDRNSRLLANTGKDTVQFGLQICFDLSGF